MRLFLIVAITFIFLLNYSCLISHKIKLDQKEFKGSFRIDGYYVVDDKGIFKKYKSVFIFYKNGVFQEPFSFKKGENVDSLLLNPNDYMLRRKKIRYGWGLYNINNDSLIIQQWGLDPRISKSVVTYYGQIINDTTIVINEAHNTRIKKVDRKKWYGYFRKLPTKPDSTNRFFH